MREADRQVLRDPDRQQRLRRIDAVERHVLRVSLAGLRLRVPQKYREGRVFLGRYLMAFEARSGNLLWHFQTGAPIQGAPMTYAPDGRQYVAVPAGTALFTFGLPGPAIRHPAPTTRSGGR